MQLTPVVDFFFKYEQIKCWKGGQLFTFFLRDVVACCLWLLLLFGEKLSFFTLSWLSDLLAIYAGLVLTHSLAG